MTTATAPAVDLVQAEVVLQEAVQAAQQAAQDRLKTHGESAYCGFAWVDVYGVRSNSKLGKLLAKYGFERRWDGKALQAWNPSRCGTQSMDVKLMGALAFAKVLTDKLGLRAYADQRPD